MSLEQKLTKLAQNNLNVLLIGRHGIGKTTLVKTVTEKLGLKLKYYSASTLDPWADLVGIPVPNKEQKTLDFHRPRDLEEAEFCFFDELNRAHPKVLNAILEMVQFKSINGVKLPKLKAVWGAINPPGDDYQVEELDPALVDRFHCYIKMEAEINMDYMKTRMNEKLVRALDMWWREDCGEEHRRVITPRRIEYMGELITKGLPWRDALPPGHTFPSKNLEARLETLNGGGYNFEFNRDSILENTQKVLEYIKTDPKCVLKVAEVMKRFNQTDAYACRDIIEAMPRDSIAAIFMDKWIEPRRNLMSLFSQNITDFAKKYPKITEVVFKDVV